MSGNRVIDGSAIFPSPPPCSGPEPRAGGRGGGIVYWCRGRLVFASHFACGSKVHPVNFNFLGEKSKIRFF